LLVIEEVTKRHRVRIKPLLLHK